MMAKAILGRKLGMTQIFTEEGQVVPVTVVESGNNVVVQNKTVENDGYNAVQIGFGAIKEHKVNKPMKGHFDKAGVKPTRYLREVRVPEGEAHSCGELVTVADFAQVAKVDVIGRSKGKGFQGTIRRHNFDAGRKTHGSHNYRAPGSVGQCSQPSRIFKGVRMPGHMGDERVTVRNLQVVRVDEEQNLIIVRGAVPGAKNGFVIVRMA